MKALAILLLMVAPPVYRGDEMRDNERLNSENSAIVVAAGAWSTPRTKDIPLDLELAVRFWKIIQLYIDHIEDLEARGGLVGEWTEPEIGQNIAPRLRKAFEDILRGYRHRIKRLEGVELAGF